MASGPEQRPTLEQLCERGTPAACEALAKFFSAGTGVPVSVAEAERWRRKSCEAGGGDRRWCYRILTQGDIQESATRCLTEGENCAYVGRAARDGWYGEPRARLARSFFQAGCHQDALPSKRYESCDELGLSLIMSGVGLAAVRGVELLTELCAVGSGRACTYLALARELALGADRDLGAAIAQYRDSCNLVAVYEAREAGKRVPTEVTTSNDLACLRLAILADGGKIAASETTTAHLFTEACLASERSYVRALACPGALGAFVASGLAFDPPPLKTSRGSIDLLAPRSRERRSNFAIVRILAYEACAEGSAVGCRVLAETYEALDRLGFHIDDGSAFVCPVHVSLAP